MSQDLNLPPNPATRNVTRWTETVECFGYRQRRTVTATEWVEIARVDCYCCSCGPSSTDPDCRNHGWDGRRPCERHSMAGDIASDGKLPLGVASFLGLSDD